MQTAEGFLRQRTNAGAQGSGSSANKGADISKTASNAADKAPDASQAAQGKAPASVGEADPWSKDWWAGMAKAK